jgi:hypothetical protein
MSDDEPKAENQSNSESRRSRWLWMRQVIVPRQLLNEIDPFESALRAFEQNFKIKPKKRAERFTEQVTDAKSEAELTIELTTAAIAAADRICRHVRKEPFNARRSDYDNPVLMPKLVGVYNAHLSYHDPVRRYENMLNRVRDLKSIIQDIRTYSNALKEKFGRDKLFNAYRIDFKDKGAKELSENPFIEHFPNTSGVVRSLAKRNFLRRANKALAVAEEGGIKDIAEHYLEKMGNDEVFCPTELRSALESVIQYSRPNNTFSSHATLDQLAQEGSPEQHFARACDQFKLMLKQLQRDQRINNQGLFELISGALRTDLGAIAKANRTMSHEEIIKLQNTWLRSAPHVEPFLSYVRAAEDMDKFADQLEKNLTKILSAIDSRYQQR